MLTSSPSPTLQPGAHARSATSYTGRAHYDGRLHRSPHFSSTSTLSTPRSIHLSPQTVTASHIARAPAAVRSRSTQTPAILSAGSRPSPPLLHDRMVDASTQYSLPDHLAFASSIPVPISKVAGLRLRDSSSISSDEQGVSQSTEGTPSSPAGQMNDKDTDQVASRSGAKRNAVEPSDRLHGDGENGTEDDQKALTKRPRTTATVKLMPVQYETCDPRDLVILISSMLMELIRYNDAIPLRDGHLTRFHSRAPPGISVVDYLQRLTTHATLSPPILLSMVYYIDRLCALYPAFTISSLTVHRFLITSATVASKGLSDSFWTNKTYARVGGVSLKELALLELEFLARVEWRIVPRPEVLVDYYKSLVERSEGYSCADEVNADEGETLEKDPG